MRPDGLPPRRLFAEAFVAVHVERAMQERDMTYQELSHAMATAGAPLSISSIHRMLKGQPRRRIHVNELVALSQVLHIPLADLMQPTEGQLARQVELLIRRLDGHIKAYRAEAEKASEVIRQMALVMAAGDQVTKRLVVAAALHESAVMNLIDVAVEAEDRLRSQATAASSPRGEETTTPGEHRDGSATE